MKQVYVVGGQYEDPAEFASKLNKNLNILRESDNNAKVLDIKYTVHSDKRYAGAPVYLGWIMAEVDVDITPKVEDDGITRKKKKKRWH
ncbi:MAG: hypothetical protein ACFFBP_20410 [Promethearchaeota archaeon]